MSPHDDGLSSAPRVLLADPDERSRRLYRAAFGADGWACLEATDARDALVQALTRSPALLVTELHLPIIDGFALCRELRADVQTAHLPILVVTADVRVAQHTLAARAGASTVLVKATPIDTLVLTAARLRDEARGLRAATGVLWDRVATSRDVSRDLRRAPRDLVVKSRKNRVPPFRTSEPDSPARPLLCPHCDKALTYVVSYYGGANEILAERWDEVICAAGCGSRFEYRFRTGALRRLPARSPR